MGGSFGLIWEDRHRLGKKVPGGSYEFSIPTRRDSGWVLLSFDLSLPHRGYVYQPRVAGL
jgi:hypothetical protein